MIMIRERSPRHQQHAAVQNAAAKEARLLRKQLLLAVAKVRH
jgi:hypothetical protein